MSNALEEVLGCIRQRGWSAEVVVVDDGSRDETAELVPPFRQKPLKSGCSGIRATAEGYSVRNGILHSFGEVVMFTDADLPPPSTKPTASSPPSPPAPTSPLAPLA